MDSFSTARGRQPAKVNGKTESRDKVIGGRISLRNSEYVFKGGYMKLFLPLVKRLPMFCFLAALFSARVFALSPMVQFQSLVAGEGENGFLDGAFYSAQFNRPLGLALSPDGSILYVADQKNNRIRAVLLDQKNKVETLAGTGEAGAKDGPISIATFNQPTALAVLPDGKMVVDDNGDSSLRLVDPNSKTVSTLTVKDGPVAPGKEALKTDFVSIWNLAYFPPRYLYFTQPTEGCLRLLNLETGQVETVLKNDPLVPNPKALCVAGGKIYVADQNLEQVYEVPNPESKTTPTQTPTTVPTSATPTLPVTAISVPLQPVGPAHQVIALTGWDKALYAYQADPKAPIVRLLPNVMPITFISVWANKLIYPSPGVILPQFQSVFSYDQVGFIPDPRRKGSFYVSNPANSMLYSFSDFHQAEVAPSGEDYNNSWPIHDFEYPQAKPPKTIRIMVIGRCLTYWEGNGMKYEAEGFDAEKTDYMLGLAKKMEISLNTLAAFEDIPYHFEVFNAAMHHGANVLYNWGYYVIPPITKKYDIDFLLILQDQGFNFLDQYFNCPLTSEGIPAERIDSEYMLEPNAEKYKTGPMHDFFELCKTKKLLREDSPTHWIFSEIDDFLSDPEARKPLMEIMGKNLSMLRDKTEEPKTGGGKPCQVELWAVPTSNYVKNIDRDFYKEMAQKNKIPFVDLCDDFRVVGESYWPYYYNPMAGGHFTADGMNLFAQIMVREFIQNHKSLFQPTGPVTGR